MNDYDVEVKLSKLKNTGLGLYATKNFKAGDVICSYAGELILTVIAISADYNSDYLLLLLSTPYLLLNMAHL
jgi:hypothetical protein